MFCRDILPQQAIYAMSENRKKLCQTEIITIPATCSERFLPMSDSSLRLLAEGCVCSGGASVLHSGYEIARPAPWFHQVLWTISGEGALQTGGRRHRLTQGTLWIAPAMVAHTCRIVRAPWQTAWLCFKPENTLCNIPGEPQVVQSASGKTVADTIRGIIAEADQRRPQHVLFLETHARMLRLLIEREINTGNPRQMDSRLMALEQVVQHIRNNPSAPWTLESMCRASGLPVGPDRFRQLCKACFGKAPIQLITQTRMEIARELLLSSDYLVYTIAGLVGYENEYAFTAAFHRATGDSPTHYRHKHKSGFRSRPR